MSKATSIVERCEMLLDTVGIEISDATPSQLNYALSTAVMSEIRTTCKKYQNTEITQKHAYYFSAEFLMGRAIFNNLYCLGALGEAKKLLAEHGVDINMLEEIEDDALGNGGLGRLAACFLDSAATLKLPLDGYGIRYRYGLFKQHFENGFQKETPDDWLRFGDPWGVRRDDLAVTVIFAEDSVCAVPYDVPIIGYGNDCVRRLRLWQSEAIEPFDLDLFNEQKYDKAAKSRVDAENITSVLYPNDDKEAGKRLRIKQEYFFSSASIQDIIRSYKRNHTDFSDFSKLIAIQLNDTHPTVAIPELIRILIDEEGLSLMAAFEIAKEVFSYTNHTIMSEGLESWSTRLFRATLPRVYRVIQQLDGMLVDELTNRGVDKEELVTLKIISGGSVHMARLAVFCSHTINGVAKIHTDIIKTATLAQWYKLYPERFQNKTNGVTQRRWLGLCNPQLSSYLTSLVGDGWETDLTRLKILHKFENDDTVLTRINEIKSEKKKELAEYVKLHEHFELNPNFIFDIQAKRLHEYKRQLLNAFSIMDIYFSLKAGLLTDFEPTAFIFGAKAASGYFRAKGIIKYINEIANIINNDPEVSDKMQVVFVSNYCVSYAEKLIPAADISEQISTAGTEASGTGNMKFMMNGAVTLGTFDGANIEIVENSDKTSNYIFGLRVDDIEKQEDTYLPQKIYKTNKRVKRVLDTLVDGTVSDGDTGMFKELYSAILDGASWHKADNYYLLADFDSYVSTKLKANHDYKNRLEFARKALNNIAGSGVFSSDRTVSEYARDIWGIVEEKA